LMYMRNRYYDPATGRFTQEDPIGLAGGLNLYGFANGDPINFSDPFGLCPIWVDGIPCVGPVAGASDLVAANGPPPSGKRGSEWGITRFSGGVRNVKHSGLDAAASVGTSLRAPAGATATTGVDAKSGLYVAMDLGNGYTVSFSHLSDVPDMFKDADGNIDHSIAVQVGTGDVVGIAGITGNSKTSGRDPHVHITTREHGKDFNPRAFYSNHNE
ncbi:MAG: RHS repeat-associated core domain-containing protein, partial [Gemmatimonadales bacterium]